MRKKYRYEEVRRPDDLVLTPRLRAVHPICLDILYKRGVRTAEEMESYLFPSLMKEIRALPPLKDTDAAVEILARAIREHEEIAVYQDYDVDGCTAGAIAYDCLTYLGGTVHRYCNERSVDGFGICPAGVDRILGQWPDTKILLTVDNGIAGIAGVARAKERGLRVIVTGHHLPDSVLPAADAMIDPKRADEPEEQYKDHCGAGVIWRVMLELYIEMGMSVDHVMGCVDLAALGTVADVVPLLGPDRALVQEGLRRMNDGSRPFFRVASEILGLQAIDAQYGIAFRIAPMINAVSRMGEDVSFVGELLLSEDESFLREGIVKLDEINQERKTETEREMKTALERIPEGWDRAAIVVHDEAFQEGVVGIVAGRLAQEFCRPAIVLTKDRAGDWKGSCRSPEGFHMKDALDRCAQWLVGWGGHARAAGVTVRAEHLDEFIEGFTALADEAFPDKEFVQVETIDAILPAAACTEQTIRELRILEPYGTGAPQPLFGLIADITDVRTMGAEGQHVKYIDKTGLAIIQWNARARSCGPRKFVGHPQLNEWNGRVSPQFIVD